MRRPHIDRTTLDHYIESEGFDLSRIPILCSGTDDSPHPKTSIDTEPDADLVYCIKCGKQIKFAPLDTII